MYRFILSPQPQPHPPDSFAWPGAINSAGLKSHPSKTNSDMVMDGIWVIRDGEMDGIWDHSKLVGHHSLDTGDVLVWMINRMGRVEYEWNMIYLFG